MTNVNEADIPKDARSYLRDEGAKILEKHVDETLNEYGIDKNKIYINRGDNAMKKYEIDPAPVLK